MELEIFFEGGKKVSAKTGDMVIRTDQAVRSGGEGSAPEPFTLFLASIGTCAGVYVKGFCDSRGIDSSEIRIIRRHTYNKESRLIEKIELEALLPDGFPEKYRKAVIGAMDLCAVKRHLKDAPEIETTTVIRELSAGVK